MNGETADTSISGLTLEAFSRAAGVVVIAGGIEISTVDDARATGETGLVIELDPHERHEVVALSDARFLLLLTPWPATDHPGTMTLQQKAEVRTRAAEHASATD